MRTAVVMGVAVCLLVAGGIWFARQGSTPPPVATSSPAAQDITWHHTLPEALATAKKDQNLVLADFNAPWCGWCTKLDQDTLSNPKVQARLRDFTLVKIDTDQYPDIARHYNISGLPTTMILDAGGKVLHSQDGYMEPAQYLQFLAQADK